MGGERNPFSSVLDDKGWSAEPAETGVIRREGEEDLADTGFRRGGSCSGEAGGRRASESPGTGVPGG